jgi:hypothetical protein
MGLLSSKQIEYVERLIKRNATLLDTLTNTSDEDVARLLREALKKPLFEPTPRWEEGIRKRLRKKARDCAKLLGLLDVAGLIPVEKHAHYNSLAEYVETAIDQTYCEATMLTKESKKELLDLWVMLKLNGQRFDKSKLFIACECERTTAHMKENGEFAKTSVKNKADPQVIQGVC